MKHTVYSGRGFSDWEIGDVDVIHDGKRFHLFHLIIPNHDYIAHAVSPDGINWTRVKNSIHVGEPGEWDDDMLWTMNVTFSDEEQQWRMYYTGLCMAEHGAVQRVGSAVSHDLYTWEKDTHFAPLESSGPHYESALDNPRSWVSFRDPFYFTEDDENYLILCARRNTGAISRRGCTGLLHEVKGQWHLREPLVWPRVYDDMECPCMVKVGDTYYLIASIREDRKVRYWYSSSLTGPYRTHASNTLLPQGNFAGRTLWVGDELLIYSFFFVNQDTLGQRALPPPRALRVNENQELYLTSFSGWDTMRTAVIHLDRVGLFTTSLNNPTSSIRMKENALVMNADCEHEYFTCSSFENNYIWEGVLSMTEPGKCGLMLNFGDDGAGYFISLDVVNGFAQIRAWGVNENNPKEDYIFRTLQSNHFKINDDLTYAFRLINYGSYIEFSLGEHVILSLVDYTFHSGKIGIYCSCSEVSLTDSSVHFLEHISAEYGGL